MFVTIQSLHIAICLHAVEGWGRGVPSAKYEAQAQAQILDMLQT